MSVEIEVIEIPNELNQIRCERVHRKKNGKIQWKCKHKFAIDFGWETPLEDGQEKVQGDIDDAGDGFFRTKDTIKIGADSEKKGSPKNFKYTIAVWDTSNVLTEDPEIIIDP